MKTCPNCKTIGIPDDALYCPICGNVLVNTPSVLEKNYSDLQQKLLELNNKKSDFLRFQQERDTLYRTLKKNGDYSSKMEEAVQIIADNIIKEKKSHKKELFIRNIGHIMLTPSVLAALALFIFLFMKSTQKDIGTENRFFAIVLEVIMWLILMFVSGLIVLPSISLINVEFSPNYESYENDYIANYIRPFYIENKDFYGSISVDIEMEICNPDTISEKINRYIDMMDNRISEIEKKIQILVQ